MKRSPIIAAALAVIGVLVLPNALAHAERAVPIPAAIVQMPKAAGPQVAVLAGGCYWGMEAVFERIKGVKAVTSGFAGGAKADANYAAVSSERTRHAEAVRVVYDPNVVSYTTLLRVYFSIAHDPTELNRQGPDSGTSYRSAIFPQNPAQRAVAARYIAQLGKAHVFAHPIVTRLEAGQFYPAAADHQDFYDRNPTHPYIVMWDKPKVAAFKAAFPTLAVKG